jgi:hypothetical protein
MVKVKLFGEKDSYFDWKKENKPIGEKELPTVPPIGSLIRAFGMYLKVTEIIFCTEIDEIHLIVSQFIVVQ